VVPSPQMPGPRPGRTLVITAVVALAAPAAAQAHLRMGTVAVNLQASVTSSPSDAVSVGVYASDLAVHLSLQPGHTLVVRGYLGEPLLRLGPRGLAVNTSSPTAGSAGLLAKGQPADRGWQLRQGVNSVTWHDARVRALPPGATTARWTIPILLDGRPAAISGRVRRLRPSSLWPWLVLLALFAAAVPAAWHARRLPIASIALGSLAALAAVLTAAGFALDPYASPGTWIEAIDETIFAAAAAAALFLAPYVWRVAAGGGLGLLALAVGLSKGAMFLDADVLSIFPGAVARSLAVIAVAAGTAAAVSAGLWFSSERPDPISPVDVV
jgi:hypothetical protein